MKVTPVLNKINLTRLRSLIKVDKDKISRHSVWIISLMIIATIVSAFYIHIPAKRYVIFAGYNANSEISPYAKRYIKKLKEISSGVIYITDSELSKQSQQEIAPYIMHGEYKRHGEYDWGSYKRGYEWLKENGKLEDADEIIFANDSCYAPIKSFRPMFRKMKEQDVDFWGNTQNQKFNPHLQSYFLVFRRSIIQSEEFKSFIEGIKAQPDHSLYITEYEIKLTPYLEKLGYKWTSYIPDISSEKIKEGKTEDPNSYPLTLLKEYNNQFLKRRTFTEKLPIAESKKELLSYLQTKSPQTYKMITKDFPQAVTEIR